MNETKIIQNIIEFPLSLPYFSFLFCLTLITSCSHVEIISAVENLPLDVNLKIFTHRSSYLQASVVSVIHGEHI